MSNSLFKNIVMSLMLCLLIAGGYGCQTSPENSLAELETADKEIAANPDPAPRVQEEPNGNGIRTRVVVTRNFGRQLLLDETVITEKGADALVALQQVAEVETAYGGGFVNAINGLRSGYTDGHKSKEDWFVYFNGIMAKTGALDYTLGDNDVQYWDYHKWEFRKFIPAIIGVLPEPFSHGYEGSTYTTIIAYQEGWSKDAARIAMHLSQLGVADVATRPFAELTDGQKESSHLVLLGTADFSPIAEMNRVWKRLGFFINAGDNKLTVYDDAGNMAGEYGVGAGFIQATQSIWNPKGIGACENTAWMVSGTDESGVKQAVDAFINRYKDFTWACALVTYNGEIIRVL